MAVVPIFAESEQTGRHRHVSGAFQPSIKTVNNPGTTLDASDSHLINLTGTAAGGIDLITTADFNIDQTIVVINLTGAAISFLDTGTSSGNDRKLARDFALPIDAAVVLYYEPTNDVWHGAIAAKPADIILGSAYKDFDAAVWETLDSGEYRMTGLGSEFTNPPVTLVPAASYDFYITLTNTPDIYGAQIITTAVGDQDTSNREFIRSGTTFAAALITGWDQYKFVGDTTPSDLVTHDPSGSTLVATLVKTALDELDTKIESVTEAYGGSYGMEDTDLPQSVPLNLTWTEFVPTNTPTYGNARNIVAGANNGRLKIDYAGASVGTLNLSVTALLALRFPGADQTLEVGLMINGTIFEPNLLTLQATSTGGFLTTGITLPITYALETVGSVNDQDEISFAMRRVGAAFTCEVASCVFMIRGAEPGKIGGAGSTDRRETRFQGAAQTDRDAMDFKGGLVTYVDNGGGNAQELTIDYPPEGTATFAATSVWDANTSPSASLTLTGDTTLNLLAPPTNDGRLYALALKQDATGGHSVTLGTSFADTGTVLALDTAANAVSLFIFYSTDSLLHQTAVQTLLNDGDFLLAADARLKGDMLTRGHQITIEDSVPAARAYLGMGPGVVPTLEATGDNNLQLIAGNTLNLNGDESLIATADNVRIEATSVSPGLQLNTANNRQIEFGGTTVMDPSARSITYTGNASLVNDTDTQTVAINNFAFVRDAAAVNFTMPTANLAGGGSLVADAAGVITIQDVSGGGGTAPLTVGLWSFAGTGTGVGVAANTFRVDTADMSTTTGLRIHELETGGRNAKPFMESLSVGDLLYIYSNSTPTNYAVYELTELPSNPSASEFLFANLQHEDGPSSTWAGQYQLIILYAGSETTPADPRVGNFASAGGVVNVDLSNIETAYVTCNESTVTVNYSNGVNGKGYSILFIDAAGSVTLSPGPKTVFGTDITGYQTHSGTLRHWYGVRYYGPSDEYHVVAYSLGY